MEGKDNFLDKGVNPGGSLRLNEHFPVMSVAFAGLLWTDGCFVSKFKVDNDVLKWKNDALGCSPIREVMNERKR